MASELQTNLQEILNEKNTKIIPENIREGIKIFDVKGELKVLDTSDATATAADIAKDKTAYVNGEKVTGVAEISDCNAKIENLISGKSESGVYLPGVINSITEVTIDYPLSGNMNWAFGKCTNLRKIKLSDTSGITAITRTFSDCSKLKELSPLDLTNCEIAVYSFFGCSMLEELTLLNTNKITSFNYAFRNNTSLHTLSEIECDSINNISGAVLGCSNLVNLGGFINLGKNYGTLTNVNGNAVLDLSNCNNLSYESLMNVINGLYDLNLTYDVANGGTLVSQRLTLGSTNLAKLTAEEISIATNKGWTVS